MTMKYRQQHQANTRPDDVGKSGTPVDCATCLTSAFWSSAFGALAGAIGYTLFEGWGHPLAAWTLLGAVIASAASWLTFVRSQMAARQGFTEPAINAVSRREQEDGRI
ncbi:MAG TPA: hypothetical protein VKY65_10095 [Alphaproteobacteria bacterium]|nr:hypothetical protein [Alphaproteobacteria bacterium]